MTRCDAFQFLTPDEMDAIALAASARSIPSGLLTPRDLFQSFNRLLGSDQDELKNWNELAARLEGLVRNGVEVTMCHRDVPLVNAEGDAMTYVKLLAQVADRSKTDGITGLLVCFLEGDRALVSAILEGHDWIDCLLTTLVNPDPSNRVVGEFVFRHLMPDEEFMAHMRRENAWLLEGEMLPCVMLGAYGGFVATLVGNHDLEEASRRLDFLESQTTRARDEVVNAIHVCFTEAYANSGVGQGISRDVTRSLLGPMMRDYYDQYLA